MDVSGLRKEPGARKRKDGTTVTRYYKGDELIAKDCSICHEIKYASEYPKAPKTSARDGLYSRCVDCTKKEQKMYREKYKKDTTRAPYKYKLDREARTDKDIQEYLSETYPDGNKTCPTCGATKKLSKFHRNRSTKDGLNYQCAKCANRARKVKGDPKDVQARKYPDGTKVCPKCKETKSLTKFYKNRTTHDGLHRNCRSCDSTHYRTKRRQEYESHWKAHNIPFECYICQGPYEHSDHVIPTKLGGSDDPTNRLPICAYHNGSKNGALLEDWLTSKHHDIMADVLDKVVNVYNVEISPLRK